MSDYESDSSEIIVKKSRESSAKSKKTGAKRKADSAASANNSGSCSKTRSDYESDTSEIILRKPRSSSAKSKKTGAKRRADSAASTNNSGSGSTTSKKPRGTDLFQLEGDVETRSPIIKSGADLVSTVVSRVATGKVKRTADVTGGFYIDLKIYNKNDILSTRPEDRWKKAALTLKVQLDQDSGQWNQLQNFVKQAHELFLDSEPVFYSDKIHFK